MHVCILAHDGNVVFDKTLPCHADQQLFAPVDDPVDWLDFK